MGSTSRPARRKHSTRRDAAPVAPAAGPRLGKRHLLFGAVTVSGVLLISLLAAELSMRAFGVRPARHQRPHTVVLQGGIDVASGSPGAKLVKTASRLKRLGVDMGEYVPNTTFRTVYDANPRGYFDEYGGVISRINSFGMRGPEVAERKTTGTFRILGIGDSFTYGAGVRDEDTFLRKLESSLNSRPPAASSRFEVLNAGVEGYNTRDEIITLEHRWLALKPDLILIGFYLNDCYSDFTFLNRGEAQAVNKPRPPGLAQVSYLWDYVQHAWTAYRESKGIQRFYQNQFFARPDQFLENPGEKNVDWSVSRAALARAAEIGKEHDIKVAVVIFPELFSLNNRYPFKAVHKHVADACHSLGLPVLDLFDAFKGHADEKLWVHPADHHPNELGHALAADALERFLREAGLLPPA